MSLTRRRFVAISIGLAATVGTVSADAKPVAWHGIALGAEAKLQIHGVSRAEGQRLISMARAEIERLENIFSIYRSESAISRLNQNGLLMSPPAELLELLSLAKSIHAATSGRFDPTIQPLWALYAENAGRPSRNDIEAVHKFVGLTKVEVNQTAIRYADRGMALTLNGIAQGFITDRVVSLLKAEGLENAVVNVGEISAMGHNMAGEPWQVGLAEIGDLMPKQYVPLTDLAIATSAPAGTTFDGNVSHIIDPLNGLAVRSPWQCISMIHKSAAIADGLSTALVMMDEGQLRELNLSTGSSIIALAQDGRTIRI